MACPTFIDCETVNISGNADGLFSIGFTIYSASEEAPISGEIVTNINNQTYTGYVLSHQANPVRNKPQGVECEYWSHNVQITATSEV